MGIAAGAERSSTPSITRLALQALGAVVILALGYEAIHFYLRDPLHYIVNPTEKSFGIFWPRRIPLLVHIVGGTSALFVGPFQLFTGLRNRNMAIHRVTGLVYIAGIVLASSFGMYLSFFTVPRAFGIALFSLAFTWLMTVLMAFRAIKQKRIESHKEWMIRGYVLTFAFVTIRYLTDLPVLTSLGPLRDTTIGWVCWVVPLLFTELVFEWRRGLRRTV
jgi:uncharacterized membrane protein